MGSLLVFNKKVSDLTHTALTRQSMSGGEAILDRILSGAAEENMQLSLILFRIDRLDALLQEGHTRKAQKIVSFLLTILMNQTPDRVYLDCNWYNEFLLLLPGVTPEDALSAGQEIRRRFEQETQDVAVDSAGRSFTTSGGLVAFPKDGQIRQDLLGIARDAVFLAQSSGGNTILTAPEAEFRQVTLALRAAMVDRLNSLAQRQSLDARVLVHEALDALLMKYK